MAAVCVAVQVVRWSVHRPPTMAERRTAVNARRAGVGSREGGYHAPVTVPGPTTLVIMGVSGSGKSTVAKQLAERLGWPMAEGDDFHPRANVEKMRSGHPLDDEDRWPWLRSIADWIGRHEAAGQSAVVTCSALKRAYRDLLGAGHPSVRFVYLDVPRDVLEERLGGRQGHYMPASLLDSQLGTLEPLGADEPGFALRSDGRPDEVARQAGDELRTRGIVPAPTLEETP
jgi:gluconokinase